MASWNYLQDKKNGLCCPSAWDVYTENCKDNRSHSSSLMELLGNRLDIFHKVLGNVLKYTLEIELFVLTWKCHFCEKSLFGLWIASILCLLRLDFTCKAQHCNRKFVLQWKTSLTCFPICSSLTNISLPVKSNLCVAVLILGKITVVAWFLQIHWEETHNLKRYNTIYCLKNPLLSIPTFIN